MWPGWRVFHFLFVSLFSDQFLTAMRYQAKLLTLSHCTIINAMILLSILSFVGDFVTAVIIFNFISFYLPRRLQWWHLYCKTIFFLIKAKKLDNFTFNTFTFSYPIFHARVNHFPNIWTIHAKIGVRKYKISASPSKNRWMVPDLLVVDL